METDTIRLVPAEERYAQPLSYEPGRLVRSVDEPIRVGSLLWVFTDPHRGHELAYNRWYERDHYYAGCMVGKDTVAGSRWVATADHKRARFPEDTRLPFGLHDGSYACVYYILDGSHDAWLDWATPAMHDLYAADRGFQSRTHYNTGVYRHRWRAYRDPDPVPVELALDHRYAGFVALFVEPTSSQDEVDAWWDSYLPGWLAGSPVASASAWTPEPLLDTKPDFVPTDPTAGERVLHLHYVEGDPLESWDSWRRLADDLAASGTGEVVFAAPFIPTVIGTDRYVDRLWLD
jgi:hypothetical protein